MTQQLRSLNSVTTLLKKYIYRNKINSVISDTGGLTSHMFYILPVENLSVLTLCALATLKKMKNHHKITI